MLISLMPYGLHLFVPCQIIMMMVILQSRPRKSITQVSYQMTSNIGYANKSQFVTMIWGWALSRNVADGWWVLSFMLAAAALRCWVKIYARGVEGAGQKCHPILSSRHSRKTGEGSR